MDNVMIKIIYPSNPNLNAKYLSYTGVQKSALSFNGSIARQAIVYIRITRLKGCDVTLAEVDNLLLWIHFGLDASDSALDLVPGLMQNARNLLLG
jgi:hypothetical protein